MSQNYGGSTLFTFVADMIGLPIDQVYLKIFTSSSEIHPGYKGPFTSLDGLLPF